MKDASEFLFVDLYGDKPLFRSQLDLVTQLLTDVDNPYYVDINEHEKYSKSLSRLKTYISQLLSNNTTRIITEEFKTGLIQLIHKKINSDQYNSEEIVVNLISALRQKNSKILKAETKNTIRDQLNYDLAQASYIGIITSKPLELDIQSDAIFFSLRNFLFRDLLDRLGDAAKDLKSYRFNFPLESYCSLFWRGLKRIIIRYLKDKNVKATLFESLYEKFGNQAVLSQLANKQEFTEKDILDLADEILKNLSEKRYLLVFFNNAPIYGMPLIILNPTDQKNIKVYTLLQDDNEISIFKYPEQDCVLWRVFVWDNLKTSKFKGTEIPYSEKV